MVEAEEFRGLSAAKAWLILVLLSLLLVGWGLFNYFLIGQPPRQWDTGALPDTPAKSIYTSQRPPPQPTTPPQIPRLPGATTTPATNPREAQP